MQGLADEPLPRADDERGSRRAPPQLRRGSVYLLLLIMLPPALEEAGALGPSCAMPHIRALSGCAHQCPGLELFLLTGAVLRAAAASAGPPTSKCAAFVSGMCRNGALQRHDRLCSPIRPQSLPALTTRRRQAPM